MTSEFSDKDELLERLTHLDELLKNADPRSIRWLYDRTTRGLKEEFGEFLETETGIRGLVKFLDNEADILAEMDNGEME